MDLGQRVWIFFRREEYSEPLIQAYQILERAYRDRCDMLIIDRNGVFRYRNHIKMGGISCREVRFISAIRSAFDRIRERDPAMKAIATIVSQTEKAIVYQLNCDAYAVIEAQLHSGDNTNRIQRAIRCLHKTDGVCSSEVLLPPIPFAELQRMFGVPPEDPMYAVYSIDERQAHALQRYVKMDFDWNTYDYTLECIGFR